MNQTNQNNTSGLANFANNSGKIIQGIRKNHQCQNFGIKWMIIGKYCQFLDSSAIIQNTSNFKGHLAKNQQILPICCQCESIFGNCQIFVVVIFELEKGCVQVKKIKGHQKWLISVVLLVYQCEFIDLQANLNPRRLLLQLLQYIKTWN